MATKKSAALPEVSTKGGETELTSRAAIGARKRGRTRTKLVQAAIEVLGSEKGLNATVDEVLSCAGLARGTFYNYFDTIIDLHKVVGYELMHNFNSNFAQSISSFSDPALQASFWIRGYLEAVRKQPKWGWAVLNVSLHGERLLGEETHNLTIRSVRNGLSAGRFTIESVDAAVDLGLGATVSAAMSILKGERPPDHSTQVAAMILHAYGISQDEAAQLATYPLPPFEDPLVVVTEERK